MISPLLLLALAVDPEPSAPPSPPDFANPQSQAAIDQVFNEPVPVEVVDLNVGQLVRVVLKDGQSLSGKLLAHTARAYTIEMAFGSDIVLPVASVLRVEIAVHYFQHGNELWFDDPNRSRYFFGWSGMLLEHGQWYLSQKELGATFFSVGVTDFLSVDLASAFPAYFWGADGVNALLGVRGGGTVLPWLHLAAGIQMLAIPALTSRRSGSGAPLVGMISGTATFGDRSQNFTVMAGMPYSFTGSNAIGAPIFSVSGIKRLTRMLALMTENWLYLEYRSATSGFVLVNSFGIRLMGEHVACDLGLGVTSSQDGFGRPVGYPLPLVDFTYNFY